MPEKPKSYAEAFYAPRKFSCNKWDHYFEIYDQHLARHYGGAPIQYLEIGVQNGGSLEIAKMLFGAGSRIYGIDINPDCKQFESPGLADKIFVGSQTDPAILEEVSRTTNALDVIVDDGSHV